MKKLFFPILFALCLPASFSCSSLRNAGYNLTQQDAALAIRQLLSLGAQNGVSGAFSKDAIMSAIFPDNVKKIMGTLNMLGLTGEIDRFTTTLSSAAEQTASASVPIFVSSIDKMTFGDAMQIVKNGGTSATDYLRNSVGDTLRRSVRPIMQSTLDTYKLNEQWNKVIKPAQSILGSKFNPDLAYIMSVLVTDAMFRNIAQKEEQVRKEASARTTPLLQKVFSRTW
jgi:hypothetical protein